MIGYMSMRVDFDLPGSDGTTIAVLTGPDVQVWDSTGFELYDGKIENAPENVINALLLCGAIKKTK